MINIAIVVFGFLPWLWAQTTPPAPYSDVSSARSVFEAKALFDQRAQSIVRYFAALDLKKYSDKTGNTFPIIAVAKLNQRRDVELVNRAIMDASTKPYANVGTDFQKLDPFCVRKGDYDFSLRGWVTLMYQMQDHPELLYPETREKILTTLLTETGNKFALYRTFCGIYRNKETENHVLLTEGSRYLTNQLWRRVLREKGVASDYYDNTKNGMTTFLLKFMRDFLLNDFDEYNSRPYAKLSLAGLHNIYEYAEDKSVKEMAKMVIDYMSAKFASSSLDLRRVVPFCRQPERRFDTDILEGDGISVNMALLAGDLDYVHKLPANVRLSEWSTVALALGKYRVDDMILDLIINSDKPGREFYQAFHHHGYEFYTGNDKYLLNAGGKYINGFDLGTGIVDGWTVPISILPTKGGMSKPELIRILGDNREKKRSNMCVTKDFACGLNPVIPDNIPLNCLEKVGYWKFINLDQPGCSLDYDLHVAFYQRPCDGIRCRLGADTFGFFEVQSSSKMSFADFKMRVLKNNQYRSFSSKKWNTYRTSEGVDIDFIVNPLDQGTYPIKDQRISLPSDLKKWPRAVGSYVNSSGKGVIQIRNTYLNKDVIFDVRDLYNPKRIEINHE